MEPSEGWDLLGLGWSVLLLRTFGSRIVILEIRAGVCGDYEWSLQELLLEAAGIRVRVCGD